MGRLGGKEQLDVEGKSPTSTWLRVEGRGSRGGVVKVGCALCACVWIWMWVGPLPTDEMKCKGIIRKYREGQQQQQQERWWFYHP